ncbi:MAG TPA: amidase [Thermomicrobiales bacterium]|nr:amidase [Thermomicrobiales bacterium]
MTDLAWMDATRLAEAIRNRETSAAEVVEAHLARIERHNPALNAVVTLDAEGAVEQARARDLALAAGEYGGALAGVPVLLKDCHETAGMRTTAGSPRLADYVPERDGTIARRLREAGAIVLGKTNVSELLADLQTNNPVFGRTNNPWDPARIPGGSSGGAAAAVAAGLAPLDIGSDIGGSIRVPAHCCGVFGLKPTELRVSNAGHIPDLPGAVRTTRVMNCIGPLARSLDDLDLALRVIAGPDPAEPDVPPAPLPAVSPPPLDGLRVAFAPSFPGLPADAATRATVERLASALEQHGARVEERLPEIDFEEQLATRAALRAIVRMLVEPPAGGPPSAEEYFRVLQRRDEIVGAWERYFATVDALICPVMMIPAFEHRARGDDVTLDGQPASYDLLAGYCRPFNLTGHPVVTLPAGSSPEGLPIGVQLVGARWSESRLLGIAQSMAAALPEIGVRHPPGY